MLSNYRLSFESLKRDKLELFKQKFFTGIRIVKRNFKLLYNFFLIFLFFSKHIQVKNLLPLLLNLAGRKVLNKVLD